MEVACTQRLRLRRLVPEDAEFVLALVNDADWLRYIGDRGVRTLEDARRYIEQGPIAMYARHGFGLYCVELREGGSPVGICGLLKRDSLDDVDLGFALLPAHRGQGIANEAAAATLEYAWSALALPRVVAIVSPANDDSIGLLERLGFSREGMVRLTADTEEVLLYGVDAPPPAASRA